MKKLLPDMIFQSVKEISAEFLIKEGKKGIIFDIDDTLLSHTIKTVPKETKEYINSLRDNKIKIALVSNGSHERVRSISEQLGLFAKAKAGKPKKAALENCIKNLNLAKEQIVFVGDQIFTDILCAKRNQISGYLVKPIDRYENPFFYIKRLFEKPVLKKYYKMQKNKKK